MSRYTLGSFVQLLGNFLTGTLSTPDWAQKSFSEVCVDSRLLRPNSLFFALKGDHVDGHTYLPEVAQRGAVGAVVSNKYTGPNYGMPLFYVDDGLEALQYAAKCLLDQRSAKIVGVTGSVGKTTTKEFIHTLLRHQFRVSCSPGNSNSQIGVPLAIFNHTQGDEEIIVLEMGMTHHGNLQKLIHIAPPTVAVLTTVALVHACNFDDIADIARAKGQIFSHPNTELGIMHHDIPISSEIKAIGTCPKVTFSLLSPDADYYLEEQRDQERMVIIEKGQSIAMSPFPLHGAHNRHNFLSAVAVARAFGMSWEKIRQGMESLVLPERRLQHIEKNGILFINDSYNAAEVSVKAALQTLPSPKGGQKIAVLGSMLELGQFSDDCHRRVGEFALGHVDRLYCLGQECKPMYEVWKLAGRPVEIFSDRLDLVKHLRKDLKAGDCVLLKGSRGKGLWKVLEEL